MLRHWTAAAAAMISAIAGSSVAQAQPSWTGIYGGVNGFASRDKVDAGGDLLITQISGLQVNGRGIVIVPGTTLPLAASDHKTGLDWGGQLGFQWQTGSFVLGLEGDFDPSHDDVSASQTQSLPPTALTPSTTIAAQRDVRISRQWSIRARLGYAISPTTLVYATGGYANARLSVFGTDTFTNPGGPAATCAPAPCQANLGPEGPNTTTDSNARANAGGWRAGLGVDQRLGRHFSIGLEYLHSDFGTRDIIFHSSVTSFAGTFTHGDNGGTGTHGQVNAASTRVGLSSDALGVRLNFRF